MFAPRHWGGILQELLKSNEDQVSSHGGGYWIGASMQVPTLFMGHARVQAQRLKRVVNPAFFSYHGVHGPTDPPSYGAVYGPSFTINGVRSRSMHVGLAIERPHMICSEIRQSGVHLDSIWT